MKTHSTRAEPVNRHMKFSVFQRWLEANPLYLKNVPKEDLFNFFQHIVKALRGAETARLYQFLEFYIPLTLRQGVSEDELTDSALKLRSLLIDHIINDVQIAQKIKDLLITRMLSLFETLERYIHEKYSRYKEQRHLSGVNTLLEGLDAQQEMVFVTQEERFSKETTINRALRKRLVLNSDNSDSAVDWESQIHPEDYHKAQLIFDELKRRRAPLYHIGYRLMTHEGQWEHVYELGRLFYDRKDRVEGVAGIIGVASRQDETVEVAPDVGASGRWLFQSEDEIFVALDHKGRVLWMSQHFQTVFNTAGNDSASFEDLFDTENRVVARRFWKSLQEGTANATMRLAVEENGNPATYLFDCRLVDKIFRKPLFLLNAQRTREDAVYNQMAERFNQLAANATALRKISDTDTFYKAICDAGLGFFEGLSSGIVLTRGKAGYHFKYGAGFKSRDLAGELIIDEALRHQLKSTEELNMSTLDAFILKAPTLIPILRDHLPKKILKSLNQAFDFSRIEQIGGVVLYRDNQPHAIVAWPVMKGQPGFNAQDRAMLSTLSAHGSSVLTRIYFSRKLNQLQFNLIATTEHSPLGTVTVYQNAIVNANSRFCELLGVSRQKIIGKSLQDLIAAKDREQLGQVSGALKKLTATVTQEMTLHAVDGSEVDTRITFSNIQYKGKRALLLQVEDKSELRQLEKQLEHSQKTDSIGNLTSGIVHDFNNILGAIIPTAQLIHQYPQSEETGERGKVVLDMAKRADEITKQLLGYVRRSEPQTDVLDLNALLSQSKDIFAKIGGTEMEIEYFLNDTLPGIRASSSQMLQMLINLVTNARDAMPAGGKLQIGTRISTITRTEGPFDAFKPGKYVQLTVRDTGNGIPKGIREKIFEPFFTTKSEKQGSGLGLSIVYGILKKHDGYVLVQSAETKGTTFKIFLPVTNDKPLTTPAAIAEPPKAVPVAGQGKVLIVDDEYYLREVLGSMVKLLGFDFVEASSGQEAIDAYREHLNDISFVVLDYAMAGLNGKQTYFELKKLNPDVHVILCTGYAEQSAITELLREDHVKLLAKPFTIETLGERVKEVVDESSNT